MAGLFVRICRQEVHVGLYICYRRLIRHEWIYYGSKNCVIYNSWKIAVFTYGSPHFCFPWGRPCGNHDKIVVWMEREIDTYKLSRSMYHLSSTISYSYSYSNRKCKTSPFSRTAAHIFVSPSWRRPCDYHAICCMDGKRIRCLQIVSLHVPI